MASRVRKTESDTDLATIEGHGSGRRVEYSTNPLKMFGSRSTQPMCKWLSSLNQTPISRKAVAYRAIPLMLERQFSVI